MAATKTSISAAKYIFTKPFCVTSPTYPILFRTERSNTIRLQPKTLLIKCCRSSNGNAPQEREAGNRNLKDALSGIVDKQVEELLNREENRVLLDGLEKASQRVEMAKRELAEIERQELEAKQMKDYINHLETRASEIEECQREISKARAMVEEAERSLSLDTEGGPGAMESGTINKDKERWVSIKAASIAAIIGTVAGLPIASTQASSNVPLILLSAINFISCALFGVTFRYAVRRELDNFQLKTGTPAAFGIVKGLATLAGGPPLELNPGSLLSHAFDAALYVSENLLIFAFAAVSLDYCFKTRLLSPFPMKESDSRTKGE